MPGVLAAEAGPVPAGDSAAQEALAAAREKFPHGEGAGGGGGPGRALRVGRKDREAIRRGPVGRAAETPVGAGERWRCVPGGAVAGLRSPADFSQELWEAPGRAPVPCSPADSLTFTGCPAAGLPVAGLLPSQGALAAPPPSGASASALLRGGDRGPFVPDPC